MQGTFTNARGEQLPVEMMYKQFENASYAAMQDGAQVVSLPLEDQNYEMVFVLPPEGAGKKTGRRGLLERARDVRAKL